MEYKLIDSPDCKVRDSGGDRVIQEVGGIQYHMIPFVEDNGTTDYRYFAKAQLVNGPAGRPIWFEINPKPPKMFVPVMLEIELEQIDNLLASALEGGSNYWYFITNTFQGLACEAWRKNKEGLQIVDKEEYDEATEDDDDIQTHTLNWDSVEKGITCMAEKYPKHFGDWRNESDDAITGDVFLQCCLFGEVVFG